MSVGSLVHSMKYGSSGHGGGGLANLFSGGDFGRNGISDILIDGGRHHGRGQGLFQGIFANHGHNRGYRDDHCLYYDRGYHHESRHYGYNPNYNHYHNDYYGGYNNDSFYGGGFSPGWQRNSTSILSINPYGTNTPLGGIFNEIGRELFGAKHQVNNVFHMSGRPSSGFNLGDEFGSALREEISKLGGGLMSQGARFGQFGYGHGDFSVYGRVNPMQYFMQDIGAIFNR